MADPVVLAGSAQDFQRDLGRYWRHVRRNGGLNLTAQGWVYKSAFKGLLAALSQSEPAEEQRHQRVWFIRRLLQHIGDLRLAASAITAREPGELFTQPMAQRIKTAFHAWRDGPVWHEVMQYAGVTADPHRGMPPELPRARMAVLQVIGTLSEPRAGDWLPVEQVAGELKRSAYDWLFSRSYRGRKMRGTTTYYQTPYYGENNAYGITFGNVQSEVQGWDSVERGVLNVMLNGPLSWLGVVDLTHRAAPTDERTAPVACRLTPVGRWLLGIGPQPEFAEAGGRLIVQPNFTVLAIEPLSDSVITTLDQFADVQSGDRAVNYALTRESMFRGQRGGLTLDAMLTFLELHHGAPIPGNVRRSLQEWNALHGRITIHRKATLLQLADDEALAGARAALGNALRPLGGNFALVARKHSDALHALEDAGWEPLQSSAARNDAAATTSIADDGRITFLNAVPSLHALGAVAPMAEGEGVPQRITPAAVKAATARGNTVDHLLKQAQLVSGGKLSPVLEAKIRGWAGFYGSGSLKPMVLLTLSSRDALHVLAADKALAGLLTVIDGAETPYAIVDAAHADRVRALLIERGVVLDG